MSVITAIAAAVCCAVSFGDRTYAVVTFAGGQSVREIGIRTALGADPRGRQDVLLRGLRLSVGLVPGLTLSVIAVR